ncbi:MAG: 5-(carboxyamino)imidazole ribonucleotide synthase [Spirochaeta sp.]
MSRYTPGKMLGIIGGGQLGRMLIPEARRLGLGVAVYSGSPDDPAVGSADHFMQGDLTSADGIAEFARSCDYLTIEIEHVSLEGLQRAERSGCSVFPSSASLGIVQDKLTQRRCFTGLPQPRFTEIPPYPADPGDEAGWREQVVRAAEDFGFPVVQKTRRGGYDGRGVAVLRSRDDILSADGALLCADSYLEAFVPLVKELGVIAARSTSGETAVFPVTEMRFDAATNICTSVAFPARVTAQAAAAAVATAREAAARLEVVGLLAVELFVAENGEVLLNEVAPRPHNSGHGTIEGLPTSQFGQHLRAGLGLPLGSMQPVIPTVMNNLLGAEQADGRPVIHGLQETLSIPGTQLHWYGKPQVRPGRKMGHLTVTADSLEKALAHADKAAQLIRIESA